MHKTAPLFQINIHDILFKIRNLKNGESPGPDGITSKILKIGGIAVAKYLEVIFNISVNNSCLPFKLLLSIVMPIFKSG